MKDFIKWLGVNEKIAKVAVWMLIFMVTLIIINACLESIGLPHYAITRDNILNIELNTIANIMLEYIVSVLNFYAIVLLIFRTKYIKPIFKYTILYIITNIIVYAIFGYVGSQVFIILYILLFCYFYSNRNKKYLIYGVLAIIANMAIQGIAYLYKIKLINYSEIGRISQIILSIDYFVIMAVIILVKEIYLKKRGEKECLMESQVYYGGENSKMKENSLKN